MICCDEYYELGCYTHCDCVYLTDLYADMDGTWQILYSYPGSDSIHVIELRDLLIGDALSVGNRFNPNSVVYLRIRRPDQSYYSFLDFECFKLTNFVQVYEGHLVRNQLCRLEALKEDCVCPYTILWTPVVSANNECDYDNDGCFALRLSLDYVCLPDVTMTFYINNKKYFIPQAGTIYVDKLYAQVYPYRIEIQSEYCNTVVEESTLDLTTVIIP